METFGYINKWVLVLKFVYFYFKDILGYGAVIGLSVEIKLYAIDIKTSAFQM